MSKQILTSTMAAPSASVDNFSFFNIGWQSTEIIGTMPWAASGTFKNLRIATTDPGSGNTITFVLSINGTPSTLTVTLNSGETVKTDITHSVSVTAGDRVTIKCTPVSTPNVGAVDISLDFDSTTNKQSAYASASSNAVTATNYMPLQGGVITTTEANARSVIPYDGTITKLYARVTVDPNPGNWSAALYLNGTIQNGSSGTPDTRAAIPSGTTAGTVIASANFSLAVVAGDLISIGFTAAASPASARIQAGVQYICTGAARFLIFCNSIQAVTATANPQFCAPNASKASVWNQTEANVSEAFAGLSEYIIRNIYGSVPVAVGGTGAVVALRKDVANALNFTLGAADLVGSASGVVRVNLGHLWAAGFDAVGIAVNGTPRYSFSAVGGANNPSGGGGGKPPSPGRRQFGPSLLAMVGPVTPYGAG